MNRFKVGDNIVALTNPDNSTCQPRIKGNEYKVMASQYCMGCGIQMINVTGGLNPFDTVICDCGNIQPSQGLWLTYSKHFIKKEDMQEVFETALQEEDYELAGLLRDLEIPNVKTETSQ